MSKKQEISDKAQGSYKVQETKYIILNSAGLQSGEKKEILGLEKAPI